MLPAFVEHQPRAKLIPSLLPCAIYRCGYDWSIPVPKGGNPNVRGTPFNYFTQGAAVSEVEIDCLTGDSRVLRADILMDIGNSINPTIDIGQIEGAFIQGLGWLATEELGELVPIE